MVKKTDSRDLKSKNWHAAEGKQRENEAACGQAVERRLKVSKKNRGFLIAMPIFN